MNSIPGVFQGGCREEPSTRYQCMNGRFWLRTLLALLDILPLACCVWIQANSHVFICATQKKYITKGRPCHHLKAYMYLFVLQILKYNSRMCIFQWFDVIHHKPYW